MGGARHSVTDTTGNWPSWLQPDVNQFIQQYGDAIFPGGSLGTMPAGLNQQQAGFTPAQQQAFQSTLGTANAIEPSLQAGQGQLDKTVAGDYLNPATNPYLKATSDAATRQLTDQYSMSTAPGMMAAAERAGGMGGSGFNEMSALSRFGLGQNIADMNANIYGQNYQQERGRQLQADQMIPGMAQAQFLPAEQQLGVGSIQQQQAQQGLDIGQQNATRQWQFPFNELDMFGQALGTALGPAGETHVRTPNRAGWLK